MSTEKRAPRGRGQQKSAAIRWLALALLVAGFAIALTACGGSDEETATLAEPETQTTETVSEETTPADTGLPTETGSPAETGTSETGAPTGDGEVITDYLAYTGGTAGPADSSLEPIKIGWINTQGGAVSDFYFATNGAQAAVDYVNAELGGVQGHPLELQTCFITQAEEEGQQCAQQMLNDDAIDVILFGLVGVGAESIFGTVDGSKPIIIGSPGHPSAEQAENVYALSGTQQSVLAPWATFAVDVLGANKVAVLYPDVPGANTGAQVITDALKQAGAEVTSVGFDPTLNDLLGPITAAGGQDADAIIPVADGPNCVKIAKALEQIGSDIPVAATPTCLAPDVINSLGDFPKWNYGIAATLAADLSSPDVQVYREVSEQYGLKPEEATDPFAQLGWQEVVLTVKLMNQIGADNLSPETINEAMANYTGTYPMGPPALACGSSPPEQPASCNDETQFYLYKGQGQFELASSWLPGPA